MLWCRGGDSLMYIFEIIMILILGNSNHHESQTHPRTCFFLWMYSAPWAIHPMQDLHAQVMIKIKLGDFFHGNIRLGGW